MRTSLATLPRTLGARFSAEFVGPPLPPIDPGPELLERLREVRRSEVPGLGRGGAEVSDGMLPALAAVGRRPEAKAEVGEDDAIGGLDWSGLDWIGLGWIGLGWVWVESGRGGRGWGRRAFVGVGLGSSRR